jgi:hypothetical protein
MYFIYNLFNGSISGSDCIASKVWMTENYALGECGREGSWPDLIKVLSLHMSERYKENHEKSLSEQSVAKSKF